MIANVVSGPIPCCNEALSCVAVHPLTADKKYRFDLSPAKYLQDALIYLLPRQTGGPIGLWVIERESDFWARILCPNCWYTRQWRNHGCKLDEISAIHLVLLAT